MNKILMIFLMVLIPLQTMATEICPLPDDQYSTSLASSMAEMGEKACADKNDDKFFHLATGCLSGGGKAVTGLVQGFIDLVRLLIVDAPAWVWGKAREQIEKILSGEMSPTEMAAAIARINITSQSGIWEKAKDYWNAFKQFASDLKNSLMKEIKGFPCLPLEKQSQMICKGVTEVFLLVVSPAKFIQGAKWGINTAQALAKFVKETKAIQGIGDANVAARLRMASEALKDASTVKKEIMTLKSGKLHEVELPNGEKVLQFTQQMKGKDGTMQLVTREVPVDAKTLAIDSNTPMGKEILGQMVKEKGGQGSLVFIDVNHLGKVNYFSKGTQGGDDYLAGVAESLRKTLRPGDMIFKNGGDELVVVLSTNNPKVVKDISQRMINEVDHNPRVRQIFREEVKISVDKFKQVSKAKNVDELPPTIQSSLTPAEKELARKDFPRFQEQKRKEYQAAFTEQATYRGSVSVGSSILKPEDELRSVLARAEAQAAQVKAAYKARLGHDVSKYNIDLSAVDSVRKWDPPVALDPR